MMNLRNLSGERLLLLSVLGGSKVQDVVDQELDRRALFGRPRRFKRSERRIGSDPRRAA